MSPLDISRATLYHDGDLRFLPPWRLTLLWFPGRIRRLSRASPAAVPFLSPHPEL